ncbi:TlyA family RNA methyltransferase [Caulobacter sp. DWR2-3-1b2]|uniref:TlyA family RNA methyltransferase n=1 Tax=unclassified Caulobacter TaxID=2648921 RepID=UPI003CEAF3AA
MTSPPTYKRADILLVETGLFETRAKARAAIEAGLITADGHVVKKPAELLETSAKLDGRPPHPWVGRGALKLVHALDMWPIDVMGKVALDVGASTGGFTEVLLERGAEKVFACDVGRDQLNPRLANHGRVVDLSGVDARILDEGYLDETPGLVVSDVSFISVEKALPVALDLAAEGADLVCLIKPQFEAGFGRVGKNGMVRNPAIIAECIASVSAFVEAQGWTIKGVTVSPITGGDGQEEHLLWAVKG